MVEVMDVPGANKSRNDAELEVVEIESAVLTLPTEVALEASGELTPLVRASFPEATSTKIPHLRIVYGVASVSSSQ